jgi:uncharacterized protein (TIGR03086 family)
MTIIDLRPAARGLADVVRNVPEQSLDGPTPCPKYSTADLLEHIGGLAVAFTSAATKAGGEVSSQAPAGNAARLPADWRSRIPRDLLVLADAWTDPAAWTGMTRAGGVDLPGEVAGLVALDEVLIHGWDLAAGTHQPYQPDERSLQALLDGFLLPMSGPDQAAARGNLFGPVVEVRTDAPLLDRVIGLTGRDPSWSTAGVG